MSQFFQVHPENPQVRLIRQAVEIVQGGGVVIYPTDSSYALGCHIGDKAAIQAHLDGGVPCTSLELDRITPHAVGALLYMFEKAVGVSGRLLSTRRSTDCTRSTSSRGLKGFTT